VPIVVLNLINQINLKSQCELVRVWCDVIALLLSEVAEVVSDTKLVMWAACVARNEY
jgi:hypothetical protein